MMKTYPMKQQGRRADSCVRGPPKKYTLFAVNVALNCLGSTPHLMYPVLYQYERLNQEDPLY